MQTFGDLLQQRRIEAGLSQNALARAAGIDPTHLNRVERDKQGRPRTSTVLKLVRGFGWSLTDEQAQQLLRAAGISEVRDPVRAATLRSPLRVRPGQRGQLSVKLVLRELQRTLLKAVDLLAELEELVEEVDEE